MNKLFTKYSFALVLMLAMLPAFSSATNLLTNGSFEMPVISSGSSIIENPVVSPWVAAATYSALFNESGLGGMAVADGSQSLYLFDGLYRQNVGSFAADTIYELTFAVAAVDVWQYGLAWVALGADTAGDFSRTAINGIFINVDSSILKSAGEFYYGSLLLDTSDPAYLDLVGESLNVVLYSQGMIHFDDIALVSYASVGANLLGNSSFENPVIPENETSVGNPDVSPWEVSATYWAVLNEGGLFAPVAEGSQSLYVYGGTCRQNVGVISADTIYGLDAYVRANDLPSAGYSHIELLAVDEGGEVELAKMMLNEVVSAADTWTKAPLMFDSATNAAVVGKELVVNLYSGGLVHFDDVTLKTYPWNPDLSATPKNGAIQTLPFDSYLSDSITLSWNLPAASGVDAVTCSVYYGQEPANMTKVVDNQALSTIDVPVLGVGTHYWRVDISDTAINNLPFRGEIMSFEVDLYFPVGDGANLLSNSGFETPVIPENVTLIENPDISPWSVSAVYWVLFNEGGLNMPTAEGNQSLYLYGGSSTQSAGIITADAAYSLDISVMAGDLPSAGFSYVELLATGTGEPIQLDMVNLGDVVSNANQWYSVNLSFDVADIPSVIGKTLEVNLYSGGVIYFDGASVVKIPSLGALPAEYISMDVPGSAALSWTLPAPAQSATVKCDVYLGNDLLSMEKVVSNQPVSNYSAEFTSYGRYYWIIGVIDPDVNSGEPVYSELMSFDVIDRCQGAKKIPGFSYLDADLNQDCRVDLLDISILASAWINN